MVQQLKTKQLENGFTLADRSHMKYPVLIGQDILDVQIESLKLSIWFILITFVGLAKFATE